MSALVMATTLAPHASQECAEAEPVVVDVDPLAVTFTLDSGEQIVMDRQELALLLSDHHELRRAA